MKRRPLKRKATKAEKAFMAMVGEEPSCLLCASRLVELHHHGRKGLSQKVSHFMVVPLCHDCHMRWHDSGALFYTREQADAIMVRAQVRLLVMWAERCDPDTF